MIFETVYAPSVGRFISEDPAKDGSNWYVYCANNPVMFVDPLGLILQSKKESDTDELLAYIWNYWR